MVGITQATFRPDGTLGFLKFASSEAHSPAPSVLLGKRRHTSVTKAVRTRKRWKPLHQQDWVSEPAPVQDFGEDGCAGESGCVWLEDWAGVARHQIRKG